MLQLELVAHLVKLNLSPEGSINKNSIGNYKGKANGGNCQHNSQCFFRRGGIVYAHAVFNVTAGEDDNGVELNGHKDQ